MAATIRLNHLKLVSSNTQAEIWKVSTREAERRNKKEIAGILKRARRTGKTRELARLYKLVERFNSNGGVDVLTDESLATDDDAYWRVRNAGEQINRLIAHEVKLFELHGGKIDIGEFFTSFTELLSPDFYIDG